MKHEQEARERIGMLERISILENMLKNMESNFAECAKGVSPCFFCANDETCNCSDDKNCNFVWQSNN